MSKNIRELIEYPKEGILNKEIFNDSKLDVSLFCMAKGAKIGEHTSTKKGTIYVLEGKGVFVLEKKSIKMLPGVFIYMKENAVHSLKVEENTSFILTLIN